MTTDDWVGLADIATRLNVVKTTAYMWRQRGLLPDPDTTISGRPVWRWSTISRWAQDTGRL